jgi:hypothetical protein
MFEGNDIPVSSHWWNNDSINGSVFYNWKVFFIEVMMERSSRVKGVIQWSCMKFFDEGVWVFMKFFLLSKGCVSLKKYFLIIEVISFL